MTTSKTLYSFTVKEQEGNILLVANEYPWSVLQVVPTTPERYDQTLEVLQKRGYVAKHDVRNDFFIIHLASGDHDGQHPEHHVTVTQDNHEQVAAALQDCMAQAAVFYATNFQ